MCADSFLLVFLKESTEPVSGQAVVIVLLWDIEFNVNWISDAPLQNKTLQLSACLGDRYHEIWSAVLITNDWSCLLALCWQLLCCTLLFLSNKLITWRTVQCRTIPLLCWSKGAFMKDSLHAATQWTDLWQVFQWSAQNVLFPYICSLYENCQGLM